MLVVGAGPAGMAAAAAAAEAGRRVILIDDNPAPGGQIWRGYAASTGARPSLTSRSTRRWAQRLKVARVSSPLRHPRHRST